MRLGIGPSISKVAAVMRTFGVQFLKDNLKLFFDFQNTDLEHVGTGSVNFDGSNDYIQLPDPFNYTQNTISAWFKVVDDGNEKIIFENTDGTSDGLQLRINSSEQIKYKLNSTTVTSSSSSLENDWHHVAATYDGTTYCLYLNGKLETTGTVSTTINVTTNATIGRSSASAANYFEGNLTKIGFWNRALSASEVQNIVYKTYNDLQGTEKTHLISWYNLDSSTDTYNDSHGSNNGTNNGSTLQETIYNNKAPRKPRGVDNSSAALADQIGSGSASFNGVATEDNINCGASNNIIKSNTTTYVLWIKRTADTRSYVMSAQRAGTNGSLLSLAVNQTGANTESAGKITIAQWNGSSLLYNSTSSAVLDLNKWHHVAAVVTNGSQKLYVDGVLVLTSSNTWDVTSPGIGGVSEPFTIGAFNAGASLNFPGNLAQAAVYNEAMTQEKIQEISQKQYSELTTSEKSNLTSWWGLDSTIESSGTGANFVFDLNNATFGSNILSSYPTTSNAWTILSNFTYNSSNNSYLYNDVSTGSLRTDVGGVSISPGVHKFQFTLQDGSVENGKARMALLVRKVSDNLTIFITGSAITLDTSPEGIQYTYYYNIPEACDEVSIFGYTNNNDFNIKDIFLFKVNGNPGELL